MSHRSVTQSEPNSYSPDWFRFFHLTIPESRTAQEVDFICACAPLPGFRRVLDVCCGMGRHARLLCSRGYSVTGVERDPQAVTTARELGGGPVYVQADLREYQPESGAFDAVIVMSQSFGYFDATTNRKVLERLAAALRREGRIILDLWNPDFFEARQAARDLESPAGIVREEKRVADGRLLVHLAYPGGGQDDFQWQLFTPGEMKLLANSVGLTLITSCTSFDVEAGPSSDKPRIHLVLRRSTGYLSSP
jgi:SAM-dependent methyltransferase